MDQNSETEKSQQMPKFPNTEGGRQVRNKWLLQNALETFSPKRPEDSIWDFEPGTLTIVDLNCASIDENSACALFSICLGIFLESHNTAGRIVALDGAHKVETTFPTPFIRRAFRSD